MTRLVVDAERCSPDQLAPAAAWLREGRLVAFPTDTYYGLAADPRLAEAVARIFEVKGRDAASALPLVAASIEQVTQTLGPLAGASRQLAEIYWPGPLSLLMDPPPDICDGVAGGTGAVAVRVPSHAVARALAAALGYPVTATSANRSGAPPASEAGQLDWLGAERDVLIVDAGPSPGGSVSTLVDARVSPPRLVRAGAIGWDRVLRSLIP